MTLPLRPYQQAVIDKLKSLGDYAVLDIPAGRQSFGFGADRLTHERAERLILDLKMANDHRAVNANAVNADLSGLERRFVQNAMFGIRYGMSWSGKHTAGISRWLADEPIPATPPRKTLMYYHVQNALMNWSE